MACVSVLIQTQLGDSQPGFKSASVKMSFRTTHSPVCSNSKRFEICAPTSSHSRSFVRLPPYADWLQAVSIEEIPPFKQLLSADR